MSELPFVPTAVDLHVQTSGSVNTDDPRSKVHSYHFPPSYLSAKSKHNFLVYKKALSYFKKLLLKLIVAKALQLLKKVVLIANL